MEVIQVKKLLLILSSLVIFLGIVITSLNLFVYQSTKKQVNQDMQDADCILVLGAGVRNNKPTPMLRDRIKEAVRLYKDKKAPKIIMSGDHSSDEYNEVAVMKSYAIENGVLSSDIFLDHAGFSTYDSLIRARDIFQAKKVIIVTQDYHLYRALYIANSLGLDASGIPANLSHYPGQPLREAREIIARCKDVLNCFVTHQSSQTQNTISLDGDGDQTHNQAI
ncbi:MAG: YdcF family protein [Coprobacillus cateniformis]|nr:YdcF family protein [Coprobacillus cateniformis]